jgi:hypothetical protein
MIFRRLLEVRLRGINKQAIKNEQEIRRARAIVLQEYTQSKAYLDRVRKTAQTPELQQSKTVTEQFVENNQYLPNYLRPKRTIKNKDEDLLGLWHFCF